MLVRSTVWSGRKVKALNENILAILLSKSASGTAFQIYYKQQVRVGDLRGRLFE